MVVSEFGQAKLRNVKLGAEYKSLYQSTYIHCLTIYQLMDFFSHILWVHIPTRNKLWHSEALFFAMLPDLGFLLIMMYSLFWSPGEVSYAEAMTTIPKTFLDFYFLLHSFVTVGVVGIILWKFRPALLPALSGWVIHILLDMPFHETSMFATRFIYPLSSNVYFTGITWNNVLVLGVNYMAIAIVYALVLRRESMKQRMGESWKPDWIDRLNDLGARVGGEILKRKRISVFNGARHHTRRTHGEVSIENPEGIEAVEDSIS